MPRGAARIGQWACLFFVVSAAQYWPLIKFKEDNP
jgi:hypothetical protein